MEMTNIEFNEFSFPLRALRQACFLLPDGRKVTQTRRTLFYIALGVFLLLQVLVLLQLALSPLLITANVTATAAFVSGSMHTLFRHLFFLAKKTDMIALIRFIQSGPHNDCEEFDARESDMRMRSTKQIRRFSSVIMAFHACAALFSFSIIFLLPSVLPRAEYSDRVNDTKYYMENHRPLYCEMWWPWDIKKDPAYYLILLWQILCVCTNVVSTTSTDAFTCSMMLAASQRSALLARTAPLALLPRDGPASSQISDHFRAWVRYHQHYLLTFSKVNKLMGPVIFTTHVFAIINIIAFSYFTMKTDVFSALVALAYLGTVLVQVYTFASAGQHVIDHSEELGRSVVGAAQVARGGLREGPARSALLVLIARCTGAKPEELSGMGYFVVSVPLFSAVLGASISFLLVLIQFR